MWLFGKRKIDAPKEKAASTGEAKISPQSGNYDNSFDFMNDNF